MYESKKSMALDLWRPLDMSPYAPSLIFPPSFQYKLIHDRLTAGLNSTQFTN